MTEGDPPPRTTRIKSPVQVLLCKGCCCGRTDRGLPQVPVERIKAVWQQERLNRTIQLTVSGCLGPCDVPNVALILTPDRTEWLGRIEGDAAYDRLVCWARDCQAAGVVLPLPEALARHRLERFTTQEASA
jgi:cobaltochelatase CobN